LEPPIADSLRHLADFVPGLLEQKNGHAAIRESSAGPEV
jgi:hypothetical protein